MTVPPLFIRWPTSSSLQQALSVMDAWSCKPMSYQELMLPLKQRRDRSTKHHSWCKSATIVRCRSESDQSPWSNAFSTSMPKAVLCTQNAMQPIRCVHGNTASHTPTPQSCSIDSESFTEDLVLAHCSQNRAVSRVELLSGSYCRRYPRNILAMNARDVTLGERT